MFLKFILFKIVYFLIKLKLIVKRIKKQNFGINYWKQMFQKMN